MNLYQVYRVGDRVNDEDSRKKYPFALKLPHDTPLLDMLELDDRAMFAQG